MSRRTRRHALAVVCALATASWLGRARADTLPVLLEWHAPSGCPRVEDVRRELERIARVSARPEPSLLRAVGTVEQVGAEFVLRLSIETRGERGTTVIRAVRCRELQHAASLVLVLVLGDDAELVEPQLRAALPAPPAAKPARSRPPAGAAVGIEAQLVAALDVLPEPAFGPEAGILIQYRQLLVRAQAGAMFARSTSLGDGVRASFWAATLGASVCYSTPGASFGLGGCLGGVSGTLHGASDGAVRDASAFAPWYALSSSLMLDLGRGRTLRWFASAGAEIAPRPPRFEVEGLERGFVPSRVVPFVSLGAASF